MRSCGDPRGAGDRFGRQPEIGDEGSHVTGGLIDFDQLDHSTDQPPAVLGAERVPDLVEIGETPGKPFSFDLATIEEGRANGSTSNEFFLSKVQRGEVAQEDAMAAWATSHFLGLLRPPP